MCAGEFSRGAVPWRPIDFLVAGDCFGLLGARYTYSVEAITRSTLVRAARATLTAAVREQPGMVERLIEPSHSLHFGHLRFSGV